MMSMLCGRRDHRRQAAHDFWWLFWRRAHGIRRSRGEYRRRPVGLTINRRTKVLISRTPAYVSYRRRDEEMTNLFMSDGDRREA